MPHHATICVAPFVLRDWVSVINCLITSNNMVQYNQHHLFFKSQDFGLNWMIPLSLPL